MDGLSFEEILVFLLFATALYIAVWRIRHPWICNILQASPSCGEKAVGSIKDALGKIYFFCKNHDLRVEWLQERLAAREVRIDINSILIFNGSFFPSS